MKKSRLLVLSLALGGALGAVALAQQAMYKGPKVELTYFNGFTGPDKTDMDALVKRFNDTHPNIVVTSRAIPWGDIVAQLPPQVAAGRAPDVAVLNENVVTSFIARGALDEITPTMMQESGINKARFYPSLFATADYEGKSYGVPVSSVALGMYYNKDLMAKMGVQAVPKNREQFLAAARACTTDRAGRKPGQAGFDAKNLATWGAGIPIGWMGGTVSYSVVRQNGANLVGTNNDAAYTSPEAVEAVQFLVDLVQKYNVSPANATEDSEIAAFRQGKACFNFNGVWRVNEYRGQQGLNFGVVPFPRLGTKMEAAWGGSSHLVLPKQRPNYDKNKRAAALEFINWISSPAQNLAWTKAGGLPTQQAVAQDKSFDNTIVSGLFEGLPNTYATSGYPWVDQVRGAWDQAVEAALLGKKQVRAALTDGQTEANKQIEQARKQLPAR